MTKEEVLQRANEYCNERSYDVSTLTSDFKEKFADFFAKRYPEGDINDEAIVSDLKFNLDTAKSASATGRTALQQDWTKKENDYKEQIEGLNKRLANPKNEGGQKQLELPDDVKTQLAELQKFRTEEAKKSKFHDVVELAKRSVRDDLHKSFENYAKDFVVNLDETNEEQAKKLTTRFQDIFKDSIGDIKPFAPRQTRKQEEEFLASLPKIKV